MIRRLRIKFICINMTIVTIMLCVIFGLILHFTSVSLEKESIKMLHQVALAPHKLDVPGKQAQDIRLPYFVLQINEEGKVLPNGGGYYDLTDPFLLEELVALSSAKKTGVLSDYGFRYVRVAMPTTQYIIFADISSETNIMNNLIKNCLTIGAISFILFLLISILLANWAVKPVAIAWEQQRQFVADASHELKTPLTIILSNAQLLSLHGDDSELRERMTNNILSVSQQMKDLVVKLLNAAQVDYGIDSIQFSTVDLSKTVFNAMLPFDSVFYERGLTIDSDIKDDILVLGSQSHLVEVIDILLDNAQKYSSAYGHVQVSLYREGKKHCLLTVANTGKPMSSKELKNIFKRFYREDTSRKQNGSYGLGLSIAEGIVKAHKGKIWAESKGGTNTFYVQLPTKNEKM